MSLLSTGRDLEQLTDSLKGIEVSSTPDIWFVDESKFHRLVPTGYTVEINTPLMKTSRNALFGINLDGFVPQDRIIDPMCGQVHRNLSPVQPFPDSIDFVKIIKEEVTYPIHMEQLSHRFVQGNVGVVMRVSSNTSQSGNIMISQASGVARKLYSADESYEGLQFMNASDAVSDYATGSFLLADLSLNRNISVATLRKDPVKLLDMSKKMVDFCTTPTLTTQPAWMNWNAVSNQFLEDWLIVNSIANLPDQNANQITIEILFDYSNVTYLTPMIPIVPVPPTTRSRQLLDYSATFVGKPNVLKANFVYLH